MLDSNSNLKSAHSLLALIPQIQQTLKFSALRPACARSKARNQWTGNLAALLVFTFAFGMAAMGQGASQPRNAVRPGVSKPARTLTPAPAGPAAVEPVAANGTAALGPAGDRAANYRLPDGQTFYYDVDWRLVKAGSATLEIGAAGAEQRILGTADSNGVVGVLYRVHDRFESFFDSNSFCSRQISKQVEEGFRRVNTEIRFDYGRGKNVLDEKNLRLGTSKHVESLIPPCVSGILSAVYFVASRSLTPNATYSFPMNDGEHTVGVKVHVEARETVKTPAGTFKTVRVQPEAESGPLREKGKLWLWYSDDAAHMPVQIRARLSWGTLTMHLQHVERH